MAKIAKAAVRKPAEQMGKDLFSDLSEAAPRRISGKETRIGRRLGADSDYTARHIEVLEGLEPVRRRPGMYIGGTDERALPHLAAEIMDNAMDEAVAGHANRIEIELKPDDILTVRDNGRGI